MSYKFAVAAIAGLLLLSGCGNNGSPDNPDDALLNGAGGGFGSASDPASVVYFEQTVGDRVYFGVDQSTLSQEAQLVLISQANWLRENPNYTLVIEGHADEQGTREYNLALGARRANAVQEFLVSKGVQAGRIQTVSYGKERPISLCSAESCYAQNRRGVTRLVAGL